MMDQILQAKILHSKGIQMRKTVLRTASQKDSEGDTENRYLEELVRKKSHQIFKKCMPNAAEEKKLANNLDVQPAPPEIYHEDLTVDKRRHSFHKTLFPKDILYLQVVDIGNPNAYKLQVVAKHGSCSNLQNLHIMMHLPKIPAEMKYFEGGLYKFEYIRGALCSCPAIERKLYVTVDPTIFGGAEAPKLGKVGVEDLPFSTRDPEIGTSLSGCSMNSKVCYKTCIETVAHNIFGIEGSDHFTLFEEWHRKQYTFEETSADFPKTPCVKGSALLCRSIGLYIVGDMKKSYKYANKALSLNPDNVYSHICRGVLNVLQGKLTAASHDTKYSLKIDKKKELDVKQMSALLLIAAERYFEQRDFTKLYQTLMFGVGLCPTYFKSPDAMEAVKVVHYIYQMTRDPQFVFPFAPTHQKILRRFFKKEASLWHKYVLSPNEEEEHTSVPSCALQTSQKPPRRYRG